MAPATKKNMGGHHATVGSSGSLSSSVEAASSSEEGSFTVSPAPLGACEFYRPLDQSGDPMCPRGPVATDGHRNNEYQVLRRVADPVYPRQRRPCGLDVDEQVLGTHYRLHTAREEICNHQQHNHTSIHDRSSRGKKPLVVSTWSRVQDSSAPRTSGGRGNLSLHATTNRYRRHARVPLMVTIMAIARGGFVLENKRCHFFGPCFRGHDEAGLLAFEALQGLPRPARGTKTKRGSRGLESI